MSRFKLVSNADGLCLEDRFTRQNPLRIAFDSRDFMYRLAHAGKKSEMVARAIKAGPGLRLLDCTAGLGRDAFILAHLGCEVTMLERSNVIAALLADGLKRAKAHHKLRTTAARLKVVCQDAVEYLNTEMTGPEFPYDAVYIDPMFPQRVSSAEVKGEMQYLQHFVGKDEDANQLLELALRTSCRRIVLKRPLRSSWVPPVKPAHILKGKSSSFEVFVTTAG